MARDIFCVFLKRKAEGLDFQIYPGKLGERIYNEISKVAWTQWKQYQTMLINENRLNTMNPEHRRFLEKRMVNFLFKSKTISIEDHVLMKE